MSLAPGKSGKRPTLVWEIEPSGLVAAIYHLKIKMPGKNNVPVTSLVHHKEPDRDSVSFLYPFNSGILDMVREFRKDYDNTTRGFRDIVATVAAISDAFMVAGFDIEFPEDIFA